VVCLNRGEFELSDETIKFVDDEDWSETVQPCLAQDGDSLTRGRGQFPEINRELNANLCANAFHHIH
jgi:hypothetical protein